MNSSESKFTTRGSRPKPSGTWVFNWSRSRNFDPALTQRKTVLKKCKKITGTVCSLELESEQKKAPGKEIIGAGAQTAPKPGSQPYRYLPVVNIPDILQSLHVAAVRLPALLGYQQVGYCKPKNKKNEF